MDNPEKKQRGAAKTARIPIKIETTTQVLRKPAWIRAKSPSHPNVTRLKQVLRAAGSDLKIAGNMDASTRAFNAADAGLKTFIGSNTDGSSGATYAMDSLTSVTVTPTKLTEIEGGRILYRITSTAAYVQAPGDTARRSISQVAIFSDGSILVPASFTSAAGFIKNGDAGVISGQDWAASGNPKCPNSPKPAAQPTTRMDIMPSGPSGKSALTCRPE